MEFFECEPPATEPSSRPGEGRALMRFTLRLYSRELEKSHPPSARLFAHRLSVVKRSPSDRKGESHAGKT